MIREFLDGVTLRPVSLPPRWPFRVVGLSIGPGAAGLEVLVARHDATPTTSELRAGWKARHGGRPAPLLLVVLHGDQASLCGPAGDDPTPRIDVDAGQVERICREALDAPDRHAALRALRDSLPAVDSQLGSVRNEGFLATHELRVGARERADWSAAGARAIPLLDRRGHDLLRGLGFQIEPHDNVTSILRARDRKIAVAVLLNRDESPELQSDRFPTLSPVSYALSVADRENLAYVVIQHAAKIRVYPARQGVGVGRRGRTETYVECHANLMRDSDAALLWLLCSAEALAEHGTLEELLAESARYSAALAERLRERIYESVVPKLAQGIAAARRLRNPKPEDLAETYEMALTILFRLLFIAYAEDKDLLPYRGNGLYQARSLKTKAQEILKLAREGTPFDAGDTLWIEVERLFRAVDKGNREWGVPPYDGGLFSDDADESRVGALLAKTRLPNTVFGPALRDLLLVDTDEGLGPVDFRSLGVREFGTIYEGLLESELSVAETDLAVDKAGVYRPCKKNEEPIVRQDAVYLHNASGARKSSGSYFTKQFAVEHLLERALDPALDQHLSRLDARSEDDAGEQFFDFRVADIAMGSGHFLVAAIDHIEKSLSGYLAKRKLPGVTGELATLRSAATDALGPLADQVEIEDTQLLRRLIARRCIYGVDLNGTSVQLARLATWIHTFVPGLPLSLLDHHLVGGNSLVGIGTLDELTSANESKKNYVRMYSFFSDQARTLLGEAAEPLKRLARLADATPADLARARKAQAAALDAIAPARALCDIHTASRIAGTAPLFDLDGWDKHKDEIADSRAQRTAVKEIAGLNALHFPIAFPEVFLRERPGFDVILGNPPWQEATVEEDAFWARHAPGLRSLPQREQETAKAKLRKARGDLVAAYEREVEAAAAMRRALTSGPYPGMGTGDPDLYKAFCWRFWRLVCDDGGRIGVVLPRSALTAKGSTEFRLEVFDRAKEVDVTMLLNSKGWVFDEAEHRYTIGLVALAKSASKRTPVSLRGPYSNRERYNHGVVLEPAVFYGAEIKAWNDAASLPLLPTEESAGVFAQLRKSPRLDLNDTKQWRARPHAELHATNDKGLMDLKTENRPKGFWPVFKGESFDIWNPDTGTYYAWADPKKVLPELLSKRMRGSKLESSPFREFNESWCRDKSTLPCMRARIAFRDVTRATDSRTLRVTLVPPEIFIGNQAPYLLWPRGTALDEGFLLGVLSSLPLDWYARRFVETHVNYFVFNPLPIPRPQENNPLRLRAIALAGRLACPDDRFAAWAESVGVACGSLALGEKDDMIHELDAVVAHLYGLKEKQLVHIFETFHEGWDCESRLRATLSHFRKLGARMSAS